jgi:hypothetical protein
LKTPFFEKKQEKEIVRAVPARVVGRTLIAPRGSSRRPVVVLLSHAQNLARRSRNRPSRRPVRRRGTAGSRRGLFSRAERAHHGGGSRGMETMRRAVRCAPIWAGLLLAACAGYVVVPATPPTEPIPAGAAKVCIVRVGSDGALATFPIKDNGVLVGATVGGSCFCYFAAQGQHELEARSDGYDTLELVAKAGQEQFIVQAARGAVGIIRTQLEELGPDEGRAAMKTCQYHVLSQVPDGTYKARPSMVVVAK